jgi:putative oxidoreductase
MKSTTYYIERASAIIAAIVLLQTLYFKFTAHPDSVYIFTTLGVEPYGRIGSGVLELLTGGLLLFRRTSIYGAVLGLGIISAAILSHLVVLGINVNSDGGTLFLLAVVVFLTCSINIFLQSKKLKSIIFDNEKATLVH